MDCGAGDKDAVVRWGGSVEVDPGTAVDIECESCYVFSES